MSPEQLETLRSVIERESGIPTSWSDQAEVVYSSRGNIRLDTTGTSTSSFHRHYRTIGTGLETQLREDIHAFRVLSFDLIFEAQAATDASNVERVLLRLRRASVLQEFADAGIGLLMPEGSTLSLRTQDVRLNPVAVVPMRASYVVSSLDDDRVASDYFDEVDSDWQEVP